MLRCSASMRVTRGLAGLLLALSVLLLVSLYPPRSEATPAPLSASSTRLASGHSRIFPLPEPQRGSRNLSGTSSLNTVSALAWEIIGSQEDAADSWLLDLASLEVWKEPGEWLVSFEVGFFYPFAGSDLWPTGEGSVDVLVDTDRQPSTGEDIGGFLGSDVWVEFRYLGGGEYGADVYQTPSDDPASWVLLAELEAYLDESDPDQPVLGVDVPAGLLGYASDVRTMAWSRWVSPTAEEYDDWLPDSTYAEFHLGAWGGETTTTLPGTTTTTQGPPAFWDVSSSHSYATAIGTLSQRGIINGYDDGTFRPGNPVWRQHFAKMIVLTLGLPASEADVCPFGDVDIGGPSTLYPDNYIAVAAARGITQGTGPGTFGPTADIFRAQVITMVVRAAQNILPGTLLTPPGSYQNTWGTSFSSTHGPNARVAEYNGLLTGLPVTSLDPWGKMPRGEVAQVLYNLLALIEEGPVDPPPANTAQVTGVTDGDTIRADYGGTNESIRLIGFDTPETGEPFSAEAKSALTALVGGKTVELEFDVTQRDQYGRLLAYVWVGSTMANAEMLRQGLATLYTVPPNVKYVSTFQAAQDEAQAANRGIWGAAAGPPLQITSIHADASGNDNDNLNDEYIVFKVLVSGSLIGYSVEDDAGHTYYFPDRVFQTGQSFTLHTGSGTDSQTHLYWGSGSAIWNNDGDTVKVLDPEGYVVVSKGY
ncbi:MAG: thermonuclease family protein [Thermoleophilia bacterium]